MSSSATEGHLYINDFLSSCRKSGPEHNVQTRHGKINGSEERNTSSWRNVKPEWKSTQSSVQTSLLLSGFLFLTSCCWCPSGAKLGIHTGAAKRETSTQGETTAPSPGWCGFYTFLWMDFHQYKPVFLSHIICLEAVTSGGISTASFSYLSTKMSWCDYIKGFILEFKPQLSYCKDRFVAGRGDSQSSLKETQKPEKCKPCPFRLKQTFSQW